MSTYDDASLIYYPSGYKEDKIYSLKPTDGSGDLTFTRASSATRVNESGLIESVATGVPRIDYTGGGCAKLLLEPQRTNLLLRSEEFNLSWLTSNATVSANTSTSPDGTTTADKLIPSATPSVNKYIYQTPSVTNGVSHTLSVFAKASEYNKLRIEQGNNSRGAWFDLSSGTIGSISINTTATIENYGNGWFRCSATTLSVSSSVFFVIGGSNTESVQVGDGTSGILIWGAELEAGTYPTSYIPTLGTAVTRVVDAPSLAGMQANGIFGSTQGTIFLDIKFEEINYLLDFKNNVGVSKLRFFNDTNAYWRIRDLDGAAWYFTNFVINDNDSFKIALRLNGTTLTAFQNGVKASSDYTIALSVSIDQLVDFKFNKIQSMMLFPTALSDAEIIALTTI